MPKGGPHQFTLCWDCEKACGDCPWSQRGHMPVDGWVATPTKVKLRAKTNPYGESYDNSYIVHSCPLFVRDATEYGMKWTKKHNTIIRRNVKKVVK